MASNICISPLAAVDKSGRPREIEISFTERDGCFYVIAEYETSNWLQNLRADLKIKCILGAKFSGARTGPSSDEGRLQTRNCGARSRNFRAQNTVGKGMVVELRPKSAE